MSNQALDLLIDAGLITASGKMVNISVLPDTEISSRISQYSNARKQTATGEIQSYDSGKWISALFSTSSSEITYSKLLSSALVYESIIIDDVLVSSNSSISPDKLKEGLKIFEWSFDLVRAGFIKIIPISYFNKPSNDIPLLLSDDAFRSEIPEKIHDFIHKNAILKSVVLDQNDKEQMLILREGADISRRMALHVGFKDDYWVSGASLYLFQEMERSGEIENGKIPCKITWNPDGILDKEKFERWAYQTINQAMRVRLIGIYNESHLASMTGHTYVTESFFESSFMAMSGNSIDPSAATPAKFLEANNSFINIDSPETIIELRTKYSSAFERFNYSLQFVTEELSGVEPEKFERIAENLFHKEILPQVDEIRDNVNLISTSGIKGVMSNLIGLSAAVATGSTLPLVSALMNSFAGGLTEAFPAISQRQRLKNKPAYIWHRVIKT